MNELVLTVLNEILKIVKDIDSKLTKEESTDSSENNASE